MNILLKIQRIKVLAYLLSINYHRLWSIAILRHSACNWDNLPILKYLDYVKVLNSHVNPQAPIAQKVADELVFRRFQGEGVEFFLIGPH